MQKHIFNKKFLLTCLLLCSTTALYAEDSVDTYPAVIGEESYFVPAPQEVEQPIKKGFFNFGFSRKQKAMELAPVSPVVENDVVEDTSELVDENIYTKTEEEGKLKQLFSKLKDEEKDGNTEEDVVFKDIQKKIENEEIFKHDTVNRVYLDRFRPTIEENSNTFFEKRKIEDVSKGLQIVTDENQRSIYDLLKEIEQSNPDSTFEPAISLSLRDCVGLAIVKHPSVVSAQINKDIYKSRIVQAWASYFPDLSASTDFSYMRSKVPDYTYGMKSAYFPNLSAGLLLFDFGKTKTLVDIAKTDYSGSKYDLQNSINEIIYSVKSAYFNLVFAQKQIDIYKKTIEEFELQLKAAQKYFTIGKKPQIDVVIAEYNVGSAKLNLVKAINTYEVAKVNLANTLGLPEFANFQLAEELSKNSCDEILETLLEDAFSIRPDLLSYEKTVESSLLSVRKAKRDFAPDIRANGTFYKGGVDPYEETNYNVGVNLSYGGLNLLQLKKEYDIALKSYNKSLVDYENKRQSVYLEVKQAYIDLQSSIESVRQAALNVDQAKAQHYHAAGRYNAGLGDAIELKDSENTYMNAQLEYFQALLDYNTNIANLERVVGRPVEYTSATL